MLSFIIVSMQDVSALIVAAFLVVGMVNCGKKKKVEPAAPSNKTTGQSVAVPSDKPADAPAEGAAPADKAPDGAAADNEEAKKKEEDEKKEKDGEKSKEQVKEDDKDKKGADGSRKIQPYPSVKEPTASMKKKKEEELEKEKKEKIAKGFYQSKSDEDDTLEKINSLKMEESEMSRKNKSAKKAKK